MQSKDLSVTIQSAIQNQALPEKDGYVSVPDNTTYMINIENTGSSDGDAKVSVDGTDIGTFRVGRNSEIVIRRPAEKDESLVFHTEQSIAALVPDVLGKEHNGLVVVEWKQNHVRPRTFQEIGILSSSCTLSGSGCRGAGNQIGTLALGSRAGLTVMGPATGQRYTQVAELKDIDPSKSTRIALRLVAPPATSIGIRPLQTSLLNDPPRI